MFCCHHRSRRLHDIILQFLSVKLNSHLLMALWLSKHNFTLSCDFVRTIFWTRQFLVSRHLILSSRTVRAQKPRGTVWCNSVVIARFRLQAKKRRKMIAHKDAQGNIVLIPVEEEPEAADPSTEQQVIVSSMQLDS